MVERFKLDFQVMKRLPTTKVKPDDDASTEISPIVIRFFLQ